jgi:hypothetical protein
MSEVLKKPHFFDVVMNSTSELAEGDVPGMPAGVYLNQEVIVREYAFTAAELTAKQMPFSMEVIPAIVGAFDKLSKPFQEMGVAQMTEAVIAGEEKRNNGRNDKPKN